MFSSLSAQQVVILISLGAANDEDSTDMTSSLNIQWKYSRHWDIFKLHFKLLSATSVPFGTDWDELERRSMFLYQAAGYQTNFAVSFIGVSEITVSGNIAFIFDWYQNWHN